MGFAPRHYFSSLVFARLFLYFFHSYYFFVAITRKEIHSHSKDENGIPRQIFATANRRTTSLGGKSGIRSATLFLFTCFRSTLLILLSFLLFLCRYHAGVANNRFIGCLVGLLLLLFIVSFASRLPTRSNPTIDEKKFGNTLRVSEFFGGELVT